MFLETQPQGVPVKEKKFSELLREGIPHVIEEPKVWLQSTEGRFIGCAVGTMAYAAGARSQEAVLNWGMCTLGMYLLEYISRLNTGGCSREEIADLLQAKGH